MASFPEQISKAVDTEPLSLAGACRALGLLALVGASVGFLVANLALGGDLGSFLVTNQVPAATRLMILLASVGQALLAATAGGLYLARGAVRGPDLEQIARRLTPLAPLAGLPLLFRVEAWSGRELSFLVLVAMWSLATWAALAAASTVPALPSEARAHAALRHFSRALAGRWPRWRQQCPFALVLVGSLLYVAHFAYYTYCFQYGGRGGFALGIYDNLIWNILHGGAFLQATPRLGPAGSHFGLHAELLAYVLAPIYAVHQNAGTLVVIQSVLLGASAPVLYALARRHVSAGAACVLALAYLLYPGLHGANLSDFHFLPLAPIFFWSAWYFLERRRDGWAAVFIGLTLATHADVALWVVVLGSYFLLSGQRSRSGAIVAAVGTAYLVGVKLVIMPLFGGGGRFAETYRGLLPPGTTGFADVLGTLWFNPAFAATTVARTGALTYLLLLLVPLAFLPLRSPRWLLLCAPGIWYTLLPTDCGLCGSINHASTAHWIAFVFPAAALALEAMQARWRAMPPPTRSLLPILITLACGTVPLSYQHGAMLQHRMARAGRASFVFGMDAEGRRRHHAMDEIRRLLPPRAKVAGSRQVTPMLSNRPHAYNIALGLHDADYLVFASERNELVGNEWAVVTDLLRAGRFGIVAVVPPFALARRGHATDLNQPVLAHLGLEASAATPSEADKP